MSNNTTGNTSGFYQPLQPNVCPGCGRCRTCGQPAPYQPYTVPYWIPNQPYWTVGDPIYPTVIT